MQHYQLYVVGETGIEDELGQSAGCVGAVSPYLSQQHSIEALFGINGPDHFYVTPVGRMKWGIIKTDDVGITMTRHCIKGRERIGDISKSRYLSIVFLMKHNLVQ